MRRLLALLVLVPIAGAMIGALSSAWAQTPTPPVPPMPQPATWGMILGFAINAVGTMVLVKGLAAVVPYLRERMPALLPIVAGAVGPALAWVQGQLALMTGIPISLGVDEILAMFTGGSAIAIAQVFIQKRRQASLPNSFARLTRDGAPI